jgi:8-oxo-dGTP diphosphatase
MKLIDVTAAVIRKNGKVLIAQRAAGENLEGLWEFPGGKIEKGETSEQCLKRELFEEFGIDVKVGKFITESRFSCKKKNIRLLAYEVEYLGGDFSLTVHSAIAWVSFDKLASYSFAPADIPVLERLILFHRSSFTGGLKKISLKTED